MSSGNIGRDPLSYMGLEIATAAEAAEGTRDNVVITPQTMLSTDASPVQEGVVRLATIAETTTGTATDIATTPAGVAAVAIAGAPDATTTTKGIIELATDGEAVARASSILAVVPINLTAVLASPPAIGGTVAAAVTCTNFSASGTFSLSGDDVQVTEGGTGLGTSALGDLLLGSAANTYALLNIGATPRQLLQVNAGGTTAEWTSNVDIPGTLDVTGAALFDSTVEISGAMTFDDSVSITGTLLVSGLLTCNASANILTAGTALDLGSDNDSAPVNLGVGTTARAIGIGDSAAAHTITLGSLTGAASVVIQAGSGNFAVTPVAAATISLGAATTTGTITLGQSTAAGGQTIDVGNAINSGAQIVNIASGAAAADSTVNILTGVATAGSQVFNLGTGASSTAINIGSTTGTSRVTMDAGNGGINLTAVGAGDIRLIAGDGVDIIASADVVIDAVDDVTINCSAGPIDIGVDADSFAINVGIAGARTITLGNVTGATDVVFNSGTGGFAFNPTGAGDITFNVTAGNFSVVGAGNNIGIGDDAAANIVTIGSTTGAAETIIQSGVGDVIVTSTGAVIIDSVGLLELNSSAGTIGIGIDADTSAINIGTVGARVLTFGNVTGATSLALNAGTGGIALASTGTGDITINSDDTLLLDSDGVLELNSSAGSISIGNDAVSLTVSVATGAAAMTTIIGSTDTTSTTTIQAGTGEVILSAAGAVSMVPATNSVAGVALTVNGRVFKATFTGQTTASAASITLTITNSSVSPGDGVFLTLANAGGNDAQLTVNRVDTTTGGTIVVQATNEGAAALNGDIVVTGWIID